MTVSQLLEEVWNPGNMTNTTSNNTSTQVTPLLSEKFCTKYPDVCGGLKNVTDKAYNKTCVKYKWQDTCDIIGGATRFVFNGADQIVSGWLSFVDRWGIAGPGWKLTAIIIPPALLYLLFRRAHHHHVEFNRPMNISNILPPTASGSAVTSVTGPLLNGDPSGSSQLVPIYRTTTVRRTFHRAAIRAEQAPIGTKLVFINDIKANIRADDYERIIKKFHISPGAPEISFKA
jgi:hypothetical protein